jgi:transcriptional regulator with XRE-family HTH domain
VNEPNQPSSPTSLMSGLGQALRWLRERQARKQYRVADSAGITKGMLSAYETGRQRPSLESLEKLLETLGCDLNDLHNALQIVNGRPDRMRSWRAWETPASPSAWEPDAAPEAAMPAKTAGAFRAAAPGFTIHEPAAGADDPAAVAELYRVLGSEPSRPARRLPHEEEAALRQVLEGFHNLLRYWHRSMGSLAAHPPDGQGTS